MDGAGGHYVKWNKHDAERELLHDLIYVESKKADLLETESRTVVARGGVIGNGVLLVKAYKVSVLQDE